MSHRRLISYLDTVGDGFGDQRHVGLHLGEGNTGEQWSVVVIAPELPHHKQGSAEEILALCS